MECLFRMQRGPQQSRREQVCVPPGHDGYSRGEAQTIQKHNSRGGVPEDKLLLVFKFMHIGYKMGKCGPERNCSTSALP